MPALVLVLASLVLIAGCAHAGDATTAKIAGAKRSGPKQAARAAGELLGRVVLPPGTVRARRPPGGAEILLGPPLGTRLARVGNRHAFWVSHDSPATLLAFVLAHAPAGAREIASGSGERRGQPYYWWEEIDIPGDPAALRPQRLTVAIARSGTQSVALRIDARVAWHPPRPAGSLVPTSAAWLKVAVVRTTLAVGHPARRRVVQTLTLTDPQAVHRLVAAANSLPLGEPGGPVPSCPAQEGEVYVWLTFREAPRRPPLARLRADPFDCGQATVWVTVPGYPTTGLGESRRLLQAVEVAAGTRLRD